MTKEEANKALSEKVAQAMALVRECEQLAKDNELTFRFDVDYGMGGTFYVCDSEYCYDHDKGEAAWHSSSSSC